MQSRVYATVWRPSVCLPTRPPHAAAAGLLLGARRPGATDRLLHGRRSAAAAAPQHGAQKQMRAVPRCQLTCIPLPLQLCCDYDADLITDNIFYIFYSSRNKDILYKVAKVHLDNGRRKKWLELYFIVVLNDVFLPRDAMHPQY